MSLNVRITRVISAVVYEFHGCKTTRLKFVI